MRAYTTLAQIKLKVTVLGGSKAGKKTFIQALQPTGDDEDGVTNVYLRNVSDNSMIVFQFCKFDDPRDSVEWLR